MPLNEAEKGEVRESLHAMNNALNSISMQAELAKMYTDSHDIVHIAEALGIIMKQCRQCSSLVRNAHTLLIEASAAGQS